MIHDVKRAYIPTVEWRESKRIIQEAVATVPALPDHPYVVSVPVSRSLVHRKVWAYFWSASATHSSEVDLVAFLDGKEIYRQPLQRWANSGTNRWYSGIAAIGTTYTGIGEQRFVTIGGSTVYSIAPWRYNITADKFAIWIGTIAGAGSTWDSQILVQSQAGI